MSKELSKCCELCAGNHSNFTTKNSKVNCPCHIPQETPKKAPLKITLGINYFFPEEGSIEFQETPQEDIPIEKEWNDYDTNVKQKEECRHNIKDNTNFYSRCGVLWKDIKKLDFKYEDELTELFGEYENDMATKINVRKLIISLFSDQKLKLKDKICGVLRQIGSIENDEDMEKVINVIKSI